ncbi:MAG TPA: efflux RND transporter permease subunit, partial [Candidatus Melainabacteria bacterium]|nr:efflux RND transporter permease subunit [Candidatus Melainabacteria bacterium]
YRDSVSAFKQLLIDPPAGVKVPLSQVARIKSTVGATQIWREHGSRLATVRANVSGRDLSSSVADARKKVKRNVILPSGFEIVWSGEFERQREASRQLTLVLPVTLVAILFLLYLSCGSLRGALTIFGVIPLAVIGAVLALFFTGTYFSIAAGVGFIVLFGLAVKNGILVVTFINELRRKGLSIFEAVTEGAITRMKPVVMTAVIAATGLLPAALSNEIGSQSQRPFAIVIIGGLVSCTILTLYALPVLYLMVAPEVSSDRTIGRPNKESALADDQSCEVDQEVSI